MRFLAAAALTICFAAAEEQWTESRFLETVLQGSPGARELRARLEVTRADAAARGLYPNPAVRYSREGAGFAEFVEAEQVLPVSGRLRLQRQAGRAAVEAGQAGLESALWELRSEARAAFYRLVAAQEREVSLQAAVRDLGEIMRILRTRESEGEGSRYDRLRGEREAAEARAELAAARAAVAVAAGRLAALAGGSVRIARVEGPLDAGPLPGDAAELVRRALASRAELRAARRQVEQLGLERRAAERLRYPEVSLTAGLKRGQVGQRTETGGAAGVTLVLPLFNTGRAEVRRFTAEQERTRAAAARIEQQIRNEVETAWRQAAILREALEQYRRELGETAVDLHRIARVAYEEGEAGILELLDAQRVSRQARLRMIDLLAEWKLARIELDRAVGEEVHP